MGPLASKDHDIVIAASTQALNRKMKEQRLQYNLRSVTGQAHLHGIEKGNQKGRNLRQMRQHCPHATSSASRAPLLVILQSR